MNTGTSELFKPKKKQINESHRMGRETRQSERYINRIMEKMDRKGRKLMHRRERMKYERLLKPHHQITPKQSGK